MTTAPTGTSEPQDRFEGPDVALALVLTVITGIVDAIGFTRLFHVFPANQTGNLVLLGISIGDPQQAEWWRPSIAMVSFAIGVAVAYRLGRRLAPTRRRAVLQAVECLLLVAVAVLAGDVRPLQPQVHGVHLAFVLALAGCAMGLQTVIIGRVAGITMSTTFETEAIVRLTETTVDLGPPTPERRRTVIVLSAILTSYAGGAAIGAATARHWGHVLWVPAIVVGLGALWSLARSRHEPPMPPPAATTATGPLPDSTTHDGLDGPRRSA